MDMTDEVYQLMILQVKEVCKVGVANGMKEFLFAALFIVNLLCRAEYTMI